MAKADVGLDSNIQDYLADIEASRAEGTVHVRRVDLRRYDEWLVQEGIELTEAGSKDLHRFMREQEKQYSEGTVKRRYSSLKQLYGFLAGVWDVIEESPVDSLELSDYGGNNETMKSKHGDVVYVTEEEKEAIAEEASLRDELIIRLLWQTGVRRGELSIFELENVHRDERAIEVWAPKTEEWRMVYYRPSLDLLMDQWIDGGYRSSSIYADESPYLFLTDQSEQISSYRINAIVKEAAEKAGVQETMYEDASGKGRKKITAHALRHGHAVHAVKSGIDVRTLQKHMGHSKIDTTMKYLQFKDDDVKEGMKKFGDVED